MWRGKNELTIVAPLAMILLAAILALPLSVFLAGRDVQRLADERVGGMIGEMFASHLDDLADDLAHDLLILDPAAPTDISDLQVLDVHGRVIGGQSGVAPPATARAAAMVGNLARGSALDTYVSELQWRGGRPFLAVAARQPGSGKIVSGARLLNDQLLRDSFAQRLRLEGFRLEPKPPARAKDRTVAPIAWQDQTDGMAISWKRENVAALLIQRLLPVIVGLMIVIAAAGAMLLRRARLMTKGVFRAQAKAEHQALHDGLTGLANRALFEQNLELALARHRRGQVCVGVYMVDLDRFKQVNDTLGHAAGDDLIVETARRLQGTCRAGDTVARFGGDEFAIVATAGDARGLEVLAERLVEVLQDRVEVCGGTAILSGSVGMALVDAGSLDGAELLRRADQALYDAKREGRSRYSRFDQAGGSSAA